MRSRGVSWLCAVVLSVALLCGQGQAKAEEAEAAEEKDLKPQGIEVLPAESLGSETALEGTLIAIEALRAQVLVLIEKVQHLSEDVKLLSALGREDSRQQSTLAFAASTQERLRVLERTLTDLTARTERLEHETTSFSLPNNRSLPSETLSGEEQFLHAQNLIRSREIESAIAVLESFVRENPKHTRLSEAFFLLGESYALLDDNSASAEAFLKGYRVDKETEFAPRHLVRLGQSLLKLDKRAQACRAFRKFQQDFAETQVELNGIVEVEIAANACSAS